MTRAEAAELLRVGVRVIDAYAREGKLPRYQLAGSRTPRYRIEDVRQLIEGPKEVGR